MGEQLVIEGVDLEMLEAQRKVLGQIMNRIHCGDLHTIVSKADEIMLGGIEALLDEWSDGVARDKKGHLGSMCIRWGDMDITVEYSVILGQIILEDIYPQGCDTAITSLVSTEERNNVENHIRERV